MKYRQTGESKNTRSKTSPSNLTVTWKLSEGRREGGGEGTGDTIEDDIGLWLSGWWVWCCDTHLGRYAPIFLFPN